MRIITGIYKGRRFDIPHTFKARPTTDYAKESLFDVLKGYIDLEGATALDLFAGTGSISLELLSRECAQVVSVEADRDHAAFIKKCMQKIGTERNILIRGDVFKFLKSCHRQFDLIFADPPYDLTQLPDIPRHIFENNLLRDDGIFILEHGRNLNFSEDPQFIEHRNYGKVNFSLFKNRKE